MKPSIFKFFLKSISIAMIGEIAGTSSLSVLAIQGVLTLSTLNWVTVSDVISGVESRKQN